jgi:hypothetical protein
MNYFRLIVIANLSVLLLLTGCINLQPKNDNQMNDINNHPWSGIPGDPNFSLADRIAIKNVMDAYSIYWDDGDVDRFFSLFTDDAVRIMGTNENEDISVHFQSQKKAAIKRIDYIRTAGLQRRHLMMNTHFLLQTESTAHIKQYTLITSTENSQVLKTVSTVVYDVWLVKIGGIWKIEKYKSIEDSALDVKL